MADTQAKQRSDAQAALLRRFCADAQALLNQFTEDFAMLDQGLPIAPHDPTPQPGATRPLH
ncbi:hypothetical protein [Limnohabitans sp. Bal53]|uniref:hypothetical protein n=1 Tax=Limnohabitans sp. Bal53 TaxID=1977910 RepID=UPI000D3A0574|nr:hypothetical protein [Limnohabitans sp. Bal53]PUE41428.1 hypothetical protein B9Z50_06890 [Limnohabitans sp. Bal53]